MSKKPRGTADENIIRLHGGGEAGVRDTIAKAKADARAQKRRPVDPDIGFGMSINGEMIPPGGMPPDDTGMIPGCPIQVLGLNGDTIFIVDVMGQLAAAQPNELGQKYVQRLFGDRQKWLYWAFPRVDKKKKVVGWQNEKFVEMIYTAAAKRDLWNAEEQVRGRGAWLDANSKLMWHAGDKIYVEGKIDEPDDTGEHEEFFYPRRPATFSPWSEKIKSGTNPALDVFRNLQSWQWERPLTDPFLLLGWIGAAFLGAALPWRPACFVTGDRAVGKSALNQLLKDLLGKGLLDTADTTPAGIYQRVRQDCLPVAVDELEAEAHNARALGVIRLARLAASGGRMNRGGSDHTGTEFTARNCFFFSAINPPPMPAQDMSRLIMLHLRRLPAGQKAPDRIANYSVARMMLRQLMDNWHRFPACWQAYREALAAGGHDGRGQDTYGTALACADLLLGPENLEQLGFPVENLSQWSEWLSIAKLPEMADAHENWRQCLTHLLTSRVEVWRDGSRRTVGQVLHDLQLRQGHPDGITEDLAKSLLGQAGLGIFRAKKADASEPSYVLGIPHSGSLVSSLFRDTVWAGAGSTGGWQSALRQAPREVVLQQPSSDNKNWNVKRIGGVPSRCTLVNMDGFNKLLEG